MVRDLPGGPDIPGQPDRPERLRARDQPARMEPLGGPALEPYQWRLDREDIPGRETPREAIQAFRPESVSLEPITGDVAKQYAQAGISDRPWLNHAQYIDPATARVLVAFERGGGHIVERHGSAVAPDKIEARSMRLEDPAIADDAARTPGRDAFKLEGRLHVCGVCATRIRDPHALATCLARGAVHPKVREKLDSPFVPGTRLPAVDVPLAELLGDDGYEYCDGYRLNPVGGSDEVAMNCRLAWIDALRNNQQADVPAPSVTRLTPEGFRGSQMKFAFHSNRAGDGWEIATMYPDPPRP